jgi:Domain of unknown function (DUF4170)
MALHDRPRGIAGTGQPTVATLSLSAKSEWDLAVGVRLVEEAGGTHRPSRANVPFQPSDPALSKPSRGASAPSRQADRAYEPHRRLTHFSAKSRKGVRKGRKQVVAAEDGGKTSGRQLLHLVVGDELTTPEKVEFRDLKALDIVGKDH